MITRDAFRALIATPVTTFVTVLLLTVAVGANLAVFGLIDRAILTPAQHVVRPDRLFTVAFAPPGEAGRTGAGMTTTSYVTFDTLRTHVPALGAAGRLAACVGNGGRRRRTAARRNDARVWRLLPPARRTRSSRPDAVTR